MYTAFYGLREKPFSLTPDPRFLFLSESHREALAHVIYGIEQGEGFIAVTGEVGTGKTTLSRTLLQRLGSDTEVAFVFNPTLSGEELLRAISLEFGLITDGLSRADLNDQLNQFLLESRREGVRALLIVDEAQNLAPATLEEIRLLSNLETSTSKLLQILLFGQPELDEMLDSRELRQLRQRITVRWMLDPLSAAETSEYVRHRLRVAAGRDVDIFTDRALREICRRAHGIPRLVNVLCDRALLAGYAAGALELGPRFIDRAAREILSVRARKRVGSNPFRRAWPAAAVLGAMAVGALTWFGVDAWRTAPSAQPSVSAAPPVEIGALPVPALPAAHLEPIQNQAIQTEPIEAELGETGADEAAFGTTEVSQNGLGEPGTDDSAVAPE